MKRKEEIRKRAEYIANAIMIDVQANKYNTNVYDYEKECYKHSHLMDAAIEGVKWADQHPRKGLVDIEKVCEYLMKNDKGFILTEMSITELRKAMEEEYNGKRPYILKPEEREIIKRLLNIDDIDLDKLTININDEGKILVRTPDYTWKSLCGREWLIDLENESHKLVCMN